MKAAAEKVDNQPAFNAAEREVDTLETAGSIQCQKKKKKHLSNQVCSWWDDSAIQNMLLHAGYLGRMSHPGRRTPSLQACLLSSKSHWWSCMPAWMHASYIPMCYDVSPSPDQARAA